MRDQKSSISMMLVKLKASVVIVTMLQLLLMRSSCAFSQLQPISTGSAITSSTTWNIRHSWGTEPCHYRCFDVCGRFNRAHLRLQSAVGDDPAADITRTLARFDKLWKLQQANKPRSRWTKLILQDDEKKEENARAGADDDDTNPSTPGTGEEKDFVYLLEPPNFSSPSCIIVFIGGAGLGSFPQVAYQEFLIRISDKMNAAILTAPFGVLGLDHFQLAKTVGEKSRRAVLQCEDDPERMYNPNLPVYCLAHSLGCKLASIYVAATGQEFDGMGFIGYNNYGFGRTISMAKEFARSIQESSGRATAPSSSDKFNQVFSMAENLLGTFGVDFSPSPEDTERLISMKFDQDRIAKTRLFVLDDDTLDDSESFVRSCQSIQLPQMSALPGNHLAPVFFEFDLNSADIPESARAVAQSNLGGFESASFGSKLVLDELVSEVTGFLLGREPSRRPIVQPLLSSSE